MATYKTKVKDFKNISNKTDIGGAPFWGDDILGLQINANADFTNTNENLRSKLPVYTYYNGPNPRTTEHGMALILSGLTYNQANTSAVVVSEGYFLAEGEICYYPGGTFNLSTGSPEKWLNLGKGAALTESRVFADGASKEFKVEYGASVLLTDVSATGPTSYPTSGINTEFLFITLLAFSSTSKGLSEKHCTIEGALSITEIGNNLNYPAFTDFASFGTGWAPDLTIYWQKMASRVLPNGQTQIAGVLLKTMSGGSTPEVMGTMAKENISYSGAVQIPIPCIVWDQTNYRTDYQLTVSSGGVLTLRPGPSASFPSAEIYVYIDHTITGNVTTFNRSYTFNDNFLDVTP